MIDLKRALCIATVIGVGGCSRQVVSTPATPSPAANIVSNFRIEPRVVSSGDVTEGTVTLQVEAVAGTSLTLSSSDSAVVVPPAAAIPQGTTAMTFPISTTPVERDTLVTLTANAGGRPYSTTLMVLHVAANGLWYENKPGGPHAHYTADNSAITARCTYSTLIIRVNTFDFQLSLSARAGSALRPGRYENAGLSLSATQPSMFVNSGLGQLCGAAFPGGSFVVLEADMPRSGEVRRFVGSYDFRCPDGSSVLRGEIRLTNPSPAIAGPNAEGCVQ